MTKAEQVEVIKQRIDFEMDFLDVQIEKRNEAKKEFKNCSIEKTQEKQSELDMCHNSVNNQYMYLCGVLATACELNLISKDEYNKLRNQAFAKTFDS